MCIVVFYQWARHALSALTLYTTGTKVHKGINSYLMENRGRRYHLGMRQLAYIWKPESWWKRLTGKRCLRQPAQDKLWELQRMTASQPREPGKLWRWITCTRLLFSTTHFHPPAPPSHVVSTGNWPLPSGKSKQAPDSKQIRQFSTLESWGFWSSTLCLTVKFSFWPSGELSLKMNFHSTLPPHVQSTHSELSVERCHPTCMDLLS